MCVTLYLIVDDITLLLIAYHLSVILTDKQNHTDLTHWSFFQRCYMFRLSTSAIIR